MRLPRRNFLKTSTLAAVFAGFALKSPLFTFAQDTKQSNASLGFQIPYEAQHDSLFSFTRQTFDPYVGGIFQAPDALGRMIDLKLISVTSYKAQPKTKLMTTKVRDSDSFSLMFTAARRLPPFTSIHKMSHPALGKFDLFMTLHEAGDGPLYYEAVFNHI